MDKDSAIYVRHMLDAIANIEADIAGYDFERFRADRRTRQLVERVEAVLRAISNSSDAEARAHADRIADQLVQNGSLFARDLLSHAPTT
jgi:uncharacterized protein with HEPN domain